MTTSEGADAWLRIERRIGGVAPETVLRHWTDAGLLTRWWPEAAEVDPVDGGQFHLAWPDRGWHLRGQVLGIGAGKLRFSWRWDHEPSAPVREVRVHVKPCDGGTTLVVEHGPYRAGAADEAERQGHQEGWEHFLSQLGRVLAEPG